MGRRSLILFAAAFSAACNGQDYAPKIDAELTKSLIAFRNASEQYPNPAATSIEAHARTFFREIVVSTAEGSLPRFMTWPDRAESSRLASSPVYLPFQFSDGDLKRLAAENTIYTSVHFNSLAVQHLGLLTRARLEDLRASGVRDVQPFPMGAITVKATWRVVTPEGLRLGLWNASAEQVLPTHAPVPKDDKLYHRSESLWPGHIRVLPRPVAPTSVLQSPVADGSEVGLGYFYTVNAEEWKTRIRPQGSAQDPPAGSYFILVGLHIAVKAIPDWLWATFWFASPPSPALKGETPPWSNFNFGASLSMERPFGDHRIFNFARLYNPYLEGVVGYGLISHCMTCHSGAAFDVEAPATRTTGEAPTLNSLERAVRTDYVFRAAHPR